MHFIFCIYQVTKYERMDFNGDNFLFLHLVAENDVCFCKFLAPSLKYKEDFLFF